MKRSRSRLIRALSLAALMAASGTAAALWSLSRKDQAQSALDQTRISRQKIGARLQAVQDQNASLMRAQQRIEELDRRAMVGTGHRAEWAQSLARIKQELRIAEFSCEIAPPPPSRQPGPSLTANALRLKTRLRHEGEFLRLIAALQRGAIVLPRRCALEPQSAETPSITAECELDRVTLELPPAKTEPRIQRIGAEENAAKTRRSTGAGS